MFFFSRLPIWFHSEQCRCQLIVCAYATEPPATAEGAPCPMNTKQAGTVRQVLSSQTQHRQSGAGAHKTARQFY